ncbi:MAG: hypothetical protein AAGH89_16230 [Verrucomicrobiota bacterium]
MKRFAAFLVIALILGTIGFFLLGGPNTRPTFTSVGSPLSTEPPTAPPQPGSTDPGQKKPMVQIKSLGMDPVQTATDAFEDANIAFQTPDKMRIGKAQDVELILSLKKTIEELKSELGKEFPTDGAAIQAAPVMEASLTGAGFEISPAGAQRQVLRQASNTNWIWSVIPRESGQQTLRLRLSAMISIQGMAAPLEVKSFEREIPVEVSLVQVASGFLKENLQLVWVVLVLPIAGFLSRFFARKAS